jgi:plastocyanin
MTTSRHRHSAVALMLVVSVALVACTPTGTTPTPAGPPNPASPAGASSNPGGVQNAVTISGFAFSPASITVPVGTTVTWTNKDAAPHTITSDDGTTFDSGNLANGATYSFTFTKAGTFAYHCAIHSSMKGTVIVTA